MAERRRSSLLDFAIAASIAVVPIMLGIAAAGGGDSAGRSGAASLARAPTDRYVERAPCRGAEDLRGSDRAARRR